MTPATPSEDEWEYEYDDRETEDFYIPVDMANIPSISGTSDEAPRTGHPTLLRTRLRAINAQRAHTERPATTSSERQEKSTMGELQVLGLHTQNPLIMYNDQLLSCHWASIVGSDMYFSRPESDISDVSKPLRSLPSADLLAIGSAKLIAKSGRLRPKDEVLKQMVNRPPDEQSTSSGTDKTATVATPIEVQNTSNAMHSPPASFIERLNQAKLKRGDTSLLAVSRGASGSHLTYQSITTSLGGENADSDPSSEVASILQSQTAESRPAEPIADTHMSGT